MHYCCYLISVVWPFMFGARAPCMSRVVSDFPVAVESMLAETSGFWFRCAEEIGDLIDRLSCLSPR